jgi:hypothetical protein
MGATARRQLTREEPERWIAPSVDIESIEGYMARFSI